MDELDATTWVGTAELWLDPLGDDAQRSECTIAVDGDTVRYTWSHEGAPCEGRITRHDDGAEFTDSWHQPEPMTCEPVVGATGLLQVQGSYGPDADWGWRIGFFHRPTDELVIQMTNIAPWGEEARAMRMICRRS